MKVAPQYQEVDVLPQQSGTEERVHRCSDIPDDKWPEAPWLAGRRAADVELPAAHCEAAEVVAKLPLGHVELGLRYLPPLPGLEVVTYLPQHPWRQRRGL